MITTRGNNNLAHFMINENFRSTDTKRSTVQRLHNTVLHKNNNSSETDTETKLESV